MLRMNWVAAKLSWYTLSTAKPLFAATSFTLAEVTPQRRCYGHDLFIEGEVQSERNATCVRLEEPGAGDRNRLKEGMGRESACFASGGCVADSCGLTQVLHL